MTADQQLIRARVVDVPDPATLNIESQVLTVVDGEITAADPDDGSADQRIDDARRAGRLIEVPDGAYLLPGLIDLHVHAPQWPQLGTGLDLPLEEWLFEHTFPLEARYADLDFADRVWDSLVNGLLANGTTTAVMYGTVHEPATELLAERCRDLGLRAFVGRVGMDHPEGTPDYYRDPSAGAGVESSARSIEAIRRLDPSGLVRPIVTPRFIPACTDDMLTGLAELAASTGTLVQTHCSESDWEHGYVLKRYGCTDSQALADIGLLTPHAVLAHAGLVTDADLGLIAAAESGIAHCPLSNSYFGDAVFPVQRALDAGVRVGLGTDIAGGAHPGLLHQAAFAVTVSRMLESGTDPARPTGERGRPGSRIDTTTALWLATTGGAAVLGLPIGRLVPGHRFDAIEIDPRSHGGLIDTWPEVDDEARIAEKLVRLGGGADIGRVWVDGRLRRSPVR